MCAKPHTDDVISPLKEAAQEVNAFLEDLLESVPIAPDLKPALIYTLRSPGKRTHPLPN